MVEEILLNIDDEFVIFAGLTDGENHEFIVVCESGNVYLHERQNSRNRLIGALEFPLKYSEDLFKYSESIGYQRDFLQIKSYRDYVCIVQKYGQNGAVFNLKNPAFKKELKRGDYCVEHCVFPIAFYSKQDSTFLIHGTDWNRLDITCLEVDELLTDRIVDYETNSNYFDYFHSSLLVSPDEKRFTSNGWIWHPFGQITSYSIADFLKNFELSHRNVDLAEDCYNFDWDRPLCWIDEKIVAVGFSRNTENYGKTNFLDEILFVDVTENKIINRIEFNGFGNSGDGDVFGELFYDKENSRFISLNEKKGLLMSDINGKKIFADQSLISFKYSPAHRFLYQTNCKKQTIETIKL